jgi:hypothetical protein
MLTVIQDAGSRMQDGALFVAAGATLLLAFKDWFMKWSLSPRSAAMRRRGRQRATPDRGNPDEHATPSDSAGPKPVF